MSRAICLGEILIDCFSQQPGLVRADVSHWSPLPGGAPANIACALAKLGHSVEFIGAVGKDSWGEALVKLLRDMKVGRRGVQYRLKVPTRQVYFTQNLQRETAEQGVQYTFAGFSGSDSTRFADAHLFSGALAVDLFADASVLVLGTVSLAYLDARESVERAVELAIANNLHVVVDVNWQPMFWNKPAEAPGRVYDLLRKVHFLKVSEQEADWLFGTASANAIARQFPHLKGVLVVTKAKGCDYCFRQGASWLKGSVASFVVDVEDTTGASEAFTAGFVHQLLHRSADVFADEASAQHALTYASAVSALTKTRLGAIAALPTPNEVEVFLYLN